MKEADRQILQKLDQIKAAQDAGGGGVTNVNGVAPIGSSGGATPAITISAATDGAAGSMSAADKTKLDALAAPNNAPYNAVEWEADETGTATRKAIGDKIEAVVASIPTAPYLVYTALLTQSGTDAPVATVLQNTLGGTVVWSYLGAGSYLGTLNGVFTVNKTVFVPRTAIINADPETKTLLEQFQWMKWTRVSSDVVNIETIPGSGGASEDDILINTLIEIRVYP